jgi:disulfide bond formation protein DsbB
LIYSQSVIRATCRWCVVSGIAMTLLFVFGMLLLKFGPRLRAVRPIFPWALAFVTAAALGVQAGLMQKAANAPPVPAAKLAGMNAADFVDPAKSLGPADAPVTIVIFADMWCYLRVHFKHEHFTPMQLQYWALKLTSQLDRMKLDTTGHALRVGRRASALRFAMTLLSARQRFARQARMLLARVEQAMAANGETPH